VRVLLRILALIAAFTVVGTVMFILRVPGTRNAIAFATASAFGAVTVIGWVVSLVGGPFAAVQLWRLRESGRRAAIVVFGYGFAYYVVGLLVFRDPGVAIAPIVLGAVSFGVPLVILLSRRARQVTAGPANRRR
jgi:hypothetical protein